MVIIFGVIGFFILGGIDWILLLIVIFVWSDYLEMINGLFGLL